jgi:hypothetical protein
MKATVTRKTFAGNIIYEKEFQFESSAQSHFDELAGKLRTSEFYHSGCVGSIHLIVDGKHERRSLWEIV